MHPPLYTLVGIKYLADLHRMQITDATGNYDNGRTSQKKIYFKYVCNVKNTFYTSDNRINDKNYVNFYQHCMLRK